VTVSDLHHHAMWLTSVIVEVDTVVTPGAHRESNVTQVIDMKFSSAQHECVSNSSLASPKSSSHRLGCSTPVGDLGFSQRP
jgi:hypothetical protein